MRPIPALLACFLAATAGCSDPVETPSLAGEWTGTTRESDHWTFNFDDPQNPGDLTGTVVLVAGGTARGTVSGTYDHPSLTIDIRVTVDGVNPPVEHPAEYFGTVNDGMDRMEGTMVIEERTYSLNLSRTQ